MSARPNFLVLCTDQMQSFSLGCNGSGVVKTPNIDAIARQGVTFRRAYCNNNVCMPSRATMITGMTPRQHGLLTNGNCLPARVPTITQALADAGYRTHAAGKLHLQPFGGFAREEGAHSWEFGSAWNDGTIRNLPSPYYGFQTTDFVGGHVSYVFGNYRQWLDAKHPGTWGKYQPAAAYHSSGRAYRMDVPPELHYNHWIADRSIDFLNGVRDGESFFLFCSFPDPHFPFAACRPYSEMYDPADVPLPTTWDQREDVCGFLQANRRTPRQAASPEEPELREIIGQTYGMITHVDDNVGRVMAALEARGLDANTIVVLLADHGEYLGSHGLLHKGVWPWEELLRVPYVWRAPGGRPTRRAVDDTVSLLDLVPTVADYAGIDPSHFDMRGLGGGERPGLPGRSLRPYLDGTAEIERAPAIVEYDEDWHAGSPLCRMRGIVDGDYKLIVWAGFDEGLLIDLAADPAETRNLWNDPAHAAKKCELMRKLLERLAYSDRFDTPRISGA